MIKFILTIKDRNSNISLEGETEIEILDNIGKLQTLKNKSDKILGNDIKIPENVMKKLGSLTNVEKIMAMLYFSKYAFSKNDLYKRNETLQIKETWWRSNNFFRDIKKKASDGFITISNDTKPKYKLTQKGISHIKQILNLSKLENNSQQI